MKKITGISLARSPEGLRVAFAYSEIDEMGNITASNQRGSYIDFSEDTEHFLAGLESAALKHLGD